ncbi:MAG TPA: DUF447 family protein [Methanothermobacter sp.]|nr:conserved hypothetical protein [Methanothermobacter sp. MT-2]HOK72931.1 DUF447 family protein [Methanothermobacter sp.]HOL68983.1 DUF447 family protein [Methanothermobacter sp.]HPQ04880.1 DUF447 family protein [Methanothermobacter sp.]HPU36813.1 DUF447 family protein [Methanothermobacter sp.]
MEEIKDYKEVKSLESLKMEKGMLYETIITSIDENGKGNAAPIGVVCKNPSEIILYLYEGSHTLSNILNSGNFTVNITHDPLLFTEATLGDLRGDFFIPYSQYLILKGASSFFTATTKDVKSVKRRDRYGESKLFIIKADVKNIFKGKNFKEPLNRGIYAVIESLINYTRIDRAENKEDILGRILDMKRVVDKVGGSREKLAMKKIVDSLRNLKVD